MKEHKKEALGQLAITAVCMGIGIFFLWLIFRGGLI